MITYVLCSDRGRVEVSEDDARVDESVQVGISVQVRHAGLSALPDLGDQPGRMIGRL